MHKFCNVDVISLGDQQIKGSSGTKHDIVIKQENEQKKYSLTVHDGNPILLFL